MILTHFSQRYPGWVRLPAAAGPEDAHTRLALAFDGMTLTLDQLAALPGTQPALEAALSAFMHRKGGDRATAGRAVAKANKGHKS